MKKNYLFLRDPWKDVKNIDSGWGNRLVCWEAANMINRAMGDTHIIKVLPAEYPELLIVDFPNTEYLTPDEWSKPSTSIDNSTVSTWLEEQQITLPNNVSYNTNFDFKSSMDIIQNFYNKKFDVIPKLRFRDENLYSTLRSYASDKIGIHIRRGWGVKVTRKDISTIPKPYKKYYELCPECDKTYPFVRDEIYYDKIDNFILENNDAKFFIGIDINEKALDYYKEKYPNRIVTFSDIVKDNEEVIVKTKILERRLQLIDMGRILLDFFTLAYCKTIVGSPASTWSWMAERILKKYEFQKTFSYEKRRII